MFEPTIGVMDGLKEQANLGGIGRTSSHDLKKLSAVCLCG